MKILGLCSVVMGPILKNKLCSSYDFSYSKSQKEKLTPSMHFHLIYVLLTIMGTYSGVQNKSNDKLKVVEEFGRIKGYQRMEVIY